MQAVWLPQMLCSAFGSSLDLTWSQLNLQTQFHLIQINVFSSLVSLIAGCKIICLTSSLLTHVTHSSSWKVNMFSVINSKDEMQLSNKMNTYSSSFVNGQCSGQLCIYRFYLNCVGFCGYNFKFWYMTYISGWIRSRCCLLESNYFAF